VLPSLTQKAKLRVGQLKKSDFFFGVIGCSLSVGILRCDSDSDTRKVITGVTNGLWNCLSYFELAFSSVLFTDCVSCIVYVTSVMDKWSWSKGGMILTGEN